MRLAAPGVSGVSGLGVLPVAWAGVAVTAVAIITAGVVAVFVVSYLSDGFKQWMVVHGQTSVIEDAVDARAEAFAACVAAGTSADACTRAVVAAVPAPSQAAIDQFMAQTTGKGALWYVGLLAVSAVAAGGIYYGYQKGWFK
jgi:hypothetical protein